MSLFARLPVELYDEIVGHLVLSSPCEYYDRDRVGRGSRNHGQPHHFDRVIDIHRRPLNRSLSFGDLKLRLVNQKFNRAVIRAWFRYCELVVVASSENALERLNEYILGRDREVPQIIPNSVKMFAIDLVPGGYRETREIRETEEGKDDPESDEAAARLKAIFETGAMTRAIQSMPKLEALVVNTWERFESENPEDGAITVDSEEELYDSQGEEIDYIRPRVKLRLEVLQAVREGIASIFTAPSGLTGNAHLQFLTYLRLSLPCAYDIAHVTSYISEPMALRLRHLCLGFVDATGEGGDNWYYKGWQGDGDAHSGDEDYQFSNLQRKYPNVAYMQAICEFVNRCKNLESLGLEGTQHINLEGLDWRPAPGAGLKNIYLGRIRTTMDRLLSLLASGREDGACQVESFDINEVSLMDGDWETIFTHLLATPSLLHLYTYQLKYHHEGESADYAEWNNRPWENYNTIWSERDEDARALRNVIRAVEKRVGEAEEDMIQYAAEVEEMDDTLSARIETSSSSSPSPEPVWPWALSSTDESLSEYQSRTNH